MFKYLSCLLLLLGGLSSLCVQAEDRISMKIGFAAPTFSPSVGIPYQAMLRDGKQPIANAVVQIRFSLLQNGQMTYQEETVTNTNEFGVVNAVFGDGSPTGSSYHFGSIDWKYGPLELKVEMDYDGTGYTDFGLLEIKIPPIAAEALSAQTAQSVSGLKLEDIINVGNTLPNKNQFLSFNGSRWIPKNNPLHEVANNEYVGDGTIEWYGTLGISAWLRMRTPAGKYGLSSWLNNNTGYLELYGPNSTNYVFSHYNNANDFPLFSLRDGNNRGRLFLGVYNSYANGEFHGANGRLNFFVTGNPANRNHGLFSIHDANGTAKAGGYVDANGNGILWGYAKNFVVKHPKMADMVIVYGSLEGPELAIYERGTAQLVNGKAFVPFSEEFSLLGNANTMTVMTTPLSAASKNLAVVKKTESGIYVEELANGKGTYSFDWQVTMVRKGNEDFRVVRPASEFQAQVEGKAATPAYPAGFQEGRTGNE